MYSCALHIIIASADAVLTSGIKAVKALPRFTHTVTQSLTPSPEQLASGDIIIVEMPDSSHLLPHMSVHESLCALQKQVKPTARIIICAEPAHLLEVTATDYQILHAVWAKPYTAAYIQFAFLSLLRTLKLEKDAWLYKNYLETAINSVPDLIWFKDKPGAHLIVNDAFCTLVNKTRQDIEGRGHYYIWDMKKEEYEKGEYVCLDTDTTVINEGKTCFFDEVVKSKVGMRQLKTYKSPIFDTTGEILGTVGIAQDVTDIANRAAELQIFLQNMPFAMLISDRHGRILNVNKQFEEHFATPSTAIVGSLYTDWKQSLGPLRPCGRKGEEIEIERISEGSVHVFELHEENILDIFHNTIGQFCICRDVTIERTFADQMLHKANTDPLTGLYNRRYLQDFITSERGEQQVSLLYIDLDNFKQVNDTKGHQAGDETLKCIAALIRRHCPHTTSVRLGGDEFVICILGQRSQAELEEQAHIILEAIRTCFHSSEHLLNVTASVGIAWTTNPRTDIATLIRYSDAAMYQAKQRGKSCFYVNPPVEIV